jgi:hypothetical protein
MGVQTWLAGMTGLSGEDRQPMVQAGDLQDLHQLWTRRNEAVAAPGGVGAIGDPDQRAKPTGIAERHPGLTADRCVTPRGHGVRGGQIQLTPHLHELDLFAAFSHRWLPGLIGPAAG